MGKHPPCHRHHHHRYQGLEDLFFDQILVHHSIHHRQNLDHRGRFLWYSHRYHLHHRCRHLGLVYRQFRLHHGLYFHLSQEEVDQFRQGFRHRLCQD